MAVTAQASRMYWASVKLLGDVMSALVQELIHDIAAGKDLGTCRLDSSKAGAQGFHFQDIPFQTQQHHLSICQFH